jgi:Mrp family chromosome partitioning ATPase/predicted Fe-Mo cluster-binding NifX family protein
MSCKRDHEKQENIKSDEQLIQEALRTVKHKIVIMSGKGGVGKSTVAVNLAVALAEAGFKTGLLDVDLHGPSVPRLLGLVDYRPGQSDSHIIPVTYRDNLKMVSIESFLERHDQAVIWRGPMKIKAIRQFLIDVAWGNLDYLIIDSPPGTGDEPLTIAQDITGARAIIVTTPQEISLADVRKSINFCRHVDLPVLGVIENMSGYICPECGHHQDIFGSGGGERIAQEMGLFFLGRIPIDPDTVQAGDGGRPNLSGGQEDKAGKAFQDVVAAVIGAAEEAHAKDPLAKAQQEELTTNKAAQADMKIAIPTANGALANHFGHCEQFAFFTVKDSKVVDREFVAPPQHEPGVIPRWLNSHAVNVIIAGGMGSRAQGFFTEYGIKVIVGAPVDKPESIIESYLKGTLQTGQNVCDH